MGFGSFAPGFDIPQGFHANLANEYQGLADYEKNELKNPDNAEYFLAKARRVLRHQDVAPDMAEDRNIPEFEAAELVDARAKLIDALTNLDTPQNESLLAMAQSRYDCWLVMREDFPDEDTGIACKDDFYKAISLLSLPVNDDTVFSIYFDSASIALNAEGKQTVSQVAERYRDREEWTVVLKGYTDGKGNRHQNKVLSMRRAIAVKHALAQYGIPLENIAISAEGEAVEGEGQEGRRVDIQARPAYAARKNGLRTAPGWLHTEEF